MAARARVTFCGEEFPVGEGESFVVGREGDLSVDDNLYLHRRFLLLSADDGGLWWLTNVGSRLSATLADIDGRVQAWLAPGARLPLVFSRTVVWFSAGRTTYDFEIEIDVPAYVEPPELVSADGTTTLGRVSLTPDQHLMLVALAEPLLREPGRGARDLPTSAAAAERLGWTLTRFNRKLDNVAQKLTKLGVAGLHGDADKVAAGRKARLVEYALAARLVAPRDLDLLPERGALPIDASGAGRHDRPVRKRDER